MLAISLHAVRDELRDKLVPINRKYPIAELMAACRDYPGLSNARRITFEYVMLKGVNDSLADAKALVRLLAGIPAKINLIPFNPWPGTAHECSDWEQIERFAEVVNRAGYASPVRTPRGRDILAACGQLKSESVKLSARERVGRLTARRGADLPACSPQLSRRGQGHGEGTGTNHSAADRLRAGGAGDAVRDHLARPGAHRAGHDRHAGPTRSPCRRGLRSAAPGRALGLGADAGAGPAAGDRRRGGAHPQRLYYVVGGGAALAVVPLLSRLGQPASVLEISPVVWQVLATAGFAGGFVYWLLAGRTA